MNIFNTLLIQPLTNGLILFYKVLGQNMGFAIIVFSLALRFVLSPLTKPYLQSMKKMKEFEPQLAKLKKKYKDDKKGLMTAQADFYKQKGINPGAGCLPYLLQIIVLIALFKVFTGVLSSNGSVIQNLNNMLYEPLKFAPDQALNTHFLYLDVTRPDIFRLPQVPFPIPGPILLLAALIQLVSSRMMTPYTKVEESVAKSTKESTDDMQVAMQKSMSLTFPLFTIIFGISFPSGLALYWLLFSLTQAYEQYRNSGWGGLTPWIKRLGLLKS